MTNQSQPQPQWRRSSFSNGTGGEYVEVAHLPDGRVAVRDTEDRTRPAQLHTGPAWSQFLIAIRKRRSLDKSIPTELRTSA